MTVKGTVTGAETGEPLAGVNACLSNTTIGVSTNSEGSYQINHIPAGLYKGEVYFLSEKKSLIS